MRRWSWDEIELEHKVLELEHKVLELEHEEIELRWNWNMKR